MRIRRRPLLLYLSSSSSSLNQDPICLQQPPKEERVAGGEERRKEVLAGRARGGLHPDGDLPSDPLVQHLLPKSNSTEASKEETTQMLDDSSSQKTLDSQVTIDKSGRISSATESTKRRGGGFGNGDGVDIDPVVKAKPISGSNTNDGVMVKGKNRKSPPVLMGGSRCSRINGRGWRCNQQTLVGYSLCEHHLGKGRLRSMSSNVRGGRSRSSATRKPGKVYSGNHDDNIDRLAVASSTEVVDDNEENKGKMMKKIGMVKARSISSLLDETDHLAAATLSSLAYSDEPFVSKNVFGQANS